ncbi:MAG: hypothetical protein GY820_18135 [Gammaproteobacteria bacterium]|nr:hypothetical protein [Gammaproteobacteria bacterium]
MNEKNALQLISDIPLSNKNIKSFEISYLEATEKSNKYSLVNIERSGILKLKKDTGISYWQAALSKSHNEILNNSELTSLLTFHNGPGSCRKEIVSNDISRGLEKLILNRKDNQSINFLSRVKLKDGSFGYIPILDFRIKQSDVNFETVLRICQVISNQFGFGLSPVKSKDSYHAYSNKVVNFTNYSAFLGWSLLFDPIVDGRHIAHQLIDGYGALRLA